MIKEENGLIIGDLCIDPSKSSKYKNIFFSHAHSDHVKLAKNSSSTHFATKETIDLIKKRYEKSFGLNFSPLEINKKIKFDNFEIELFSNGHILGSTGINLDFYNKNYIITSDFRTSDSILFKGLKPIESEVLVLETTFASPEFNFPNHFDVVNEMVSWIEKNAKNKLIILSGYSLGKAQELTKISNMAGFVPLVHESIFEMNKIYSNHGVDIGKYELLNHNLKDHNVLIMPQNLIDKFLFSTIKEFDKRDILCAIATGWNAQGFDKCFPLSNHCDYNELIEFVKESNPKLVLTDHGYSQEFARTLNKLGYNSRPLKQSSQKQLFEF
ncbi:MAG: MBL fold metallo-hydrolase [Candidatus ainarchaeum sp.]|nr:MBL fold metallo-hydrolase [Candidatus ainarchaeum sp.]